MRRELVNMLAQALVDRGWVNDLNEEITYGAKYYARSILERDKNLSPLDFETVADVMGLIWEHSGCVYDIDEVGMALDLLNYFKKAPVHA